jgi:MSHA pilin protein MshD
MQTVQRGLLPMRHRFQYGFTLVEMIITIVIISVGLAGVLTAFTTVIKSSADPMIRKQLISLAEGMAEEITQKPYAIGSGTITGCNRSNADDIRDYKTAYATAQNICLPDGTSAGLSSSYTIKVEMDDPAAWAGTTAIRIKVTASNGNESFSVTTWRTDYAS